MGCSHIGINVCRQTGSAATPMPLGGESSPGLRWGGASSEPAGLAAGLVEAEREDGMALAFHKSEAVVREIPSAGWMAQGALKVLVIEDNPDAADSLRELLELDGYRAEVAYGGAQGVVRAREFRPAIVLCDIGLPEMDGYEVARQLRREPAMRAAYLIALTGYSRPEDQRQALRSGFDAYLAKPADLEDLERVLARAARHLESQGRQLTKA